MDSLSKDISNENKNLHDLFYTDKINYTEIAQNKYFLIFKRKYDEQKNDSIFLLETIFIQNSN